MEDVVIPGSETPVVPTSEVAGQTPTPVEAPQVEPTITPQAAPEPEPTFRLPGQQPAPAGDETEWLRRQVAQYANQAAQARQRAEELELAGLEGDELELEQLRRQNEAIQQQLQNWQQQQAVDAWQKYYAQFAPAQEVAKFHDPVEMGHHVLTQLHLKNIALQKEVDALKAAVGKPAPGPQVTTGGSGPAVTKSVSNMTPEERERMRREIRTTGKFSAFG